MFARLRLQLTLWYVGLLAVILAAVAVVVYILVARSLDSQINASLSDVNDQAVAIIRESARAAQETASEGSGENGGDHETDGHDAEPTHSGEAADDDFRSVLAPNEVLGTTGDVFLLVLDARRTVIANPRGIAVADLPLGSWLDSSADRRGATNDATVGDSRVRVLTVAVRGQGPEPISYVITGKSLEQRDRDLRQLLVLLAIGGGVGLVLAAGGGLFVANLASRPVRQAFERQRAFVADASHELRTPLAVVRANAESLLRRRGEDDRATDRDALADIVTEADYMGRLTAGLLTLAQEDRGDMELDREPTDLHDAVETTVRTGRHLAEERGVGLTAHSEHATIVADVRRLRELLSILVDNAIKYTPAGGSVTVKGRALNGTAEVIVDDTGVGIAAEHLPRLFDRFYRVDKARSREHGGLGLGLSIAQAIARAHGGSIEIQSKPDRGTQVRVILPAVGPPSA